MCGLRHVSDGRRMRRDMGVKENKVLKRKETEPPHSYLSRHAHIERKRG
jgi:hypothetical protein